MPQKNRRQQGRPRRNSESTSLLLVVGERPPNRKSSQFATTGQTTRPNDPAIHSDGESPMRPSAERPVKRSIKERVARYTAKWTGSKNTGRLVDTNLGRMIIWP